MRRRAALFVKIEGASAGSLQPTAMAALFVCPAHHGPTSIVLNLGTMQLMRTYHAWFPENGANVQWGSIMRSAYLSNDQGGALGGMLRGQSPGTRLAAKQLWCLKPAADDDVLFEVHPVTGLPIQIREPEAARGWRVVRALNSAGECICVMAPRRPDGSYDMDMKLLPNGRFPPAPTAPASAAEIARTGHRSPSIAGAMGPVTQEAEPQRPRAALNLRPAPQRDFALVPT